MHALVGEDPNKRMSIKENYYLMDDSNSGDICLSMLFSS